MKKILIFILIIVIAGCASESVKENNDQPEIKANNKKLAQELFIDASVLEAKGDINEALNKYLEANKLDPQPGIAFTIAKNYYKSNKLSSALIYSRSCVSKDPNNLEYLLLLGSIYDASHFPDSSASVYEKIVKLDSTNVTAYFNLAENYEAKRPNDAIKLYKKVIDLIGSDWNVLVRLVDINERMGNIEEAIKYFEELTSLNPSDLNLQKILIDSYIKTKNYDKALKRTEEALISFPDDLNLIEYKAVALAQSGKLNDATTEYLQLIKNKEIPFERKIGVGLSFLVEAQKDSTNLDRAKKIFEVIDKDSTDWQVKAYLGEISIRQKQDTVAINYFKQAAKLAEWNVQVWIRLGGLLFDNQKYKEANEFMEQAVEKFPNDFTINLIYGLSLSQSNIHDKAVEILKRALNINPNDATALGAIGYSLNQLKQNDEAVVYLNKALNLEPNNLQVLSIKALIHENNKEYEISDSLYTRALKIDSTNVLILNNFAYSYSERGINLDKALKMSKKAVESEPKNSSYLDTIGWIYFKLGQYEKAKLNIEEAVKTDNNNSTLSEHLGDVFFKMGQKKKALELWKKASELDPNKTELKLKLEKGEL